MHLPVGRLAVPVAVCCLAAPRASLQWRPPRPLRPATLGEGTATQPFCCHSSSCFSCSCTCPSISRRHANGFTPPTHGTRYAGAIFNPPPTSLSASEAAAPAAPAPAAATILSTKSHSFPLLISSYSLSLRLIPTQQSLTLSSSPVAAQLCGASYISVTSHALSTAFLQLSTSSHISHSSPPSHPFHSTSLNSSSLLITPSALCNSMMSCTMPSRDSRMAAV
ncbi:unnamed protein product [Closterium sp. NIES-54]